MAGINILIQIFTSFMSCLIIKSFLDALFIRRTIKNKTIFLWIFYFLLSLYCENNNNIRGGADVKVGTAEKVSKVREDKAR